MYTERLNSPDNLGRDVLNHIRGDDNPSSAGFSDVGTVGVFIRTSSGCPRTLVILVALNLNLNTLVMVAREAFLFPTHNPAPSISILIPSINQFPISIMSPPTALGLLLTAVLAPLLLISQMSISAESAPQNFRAKDSKIGRSSNQG